MKSPVMKCPKCGTDIYDIPADFCYEDGGCMPPWEYGYIVCVEGCVAQSRTGRSWTFILDPPSLPPEPVPREPEQWICECGWWGEREEATQGKT